MRGLDEARSQTETKTRGLPPVHLWNPPYHGDLDIRIHRDGSWSYLGSPIQRPALVRLFSTILRLDPDGRYYLVTPVERVGITVEDAPFLAVSLAVDGEGTAQRLTFTTSVGDSVVAGPDNPLRVVTDPETQKPAPYVHVRRGLEALISRPVYYDLAELCVVHDMEGERAFGVWSEGAFFPFSPADDVEPFT